MSEPDRLPPPTDGSERKPARSPAGKPGKPETPAFNRLILSLLFGAVVFLAFYPLINGASRYTRLGFSEFESGIQSGVYNPTNVHELIIGIGAIVFQDQPLPKDGSALEVTPRVYRVAAASMGENERLAFASLLREHKIKYRYEDIPADWQSWVFMLILGVPLILLIILMIRRVGGPGSALAFGRSRGRLYAQEDLGVTFDDVAGIDEALEELKEIVEFLKSPEKYQALGGRIPKGVLLVGPPGTGKTLLAKVVAGEAGVPFISLSGSDFVEMYVGVGAARVRDMFQQAAQRSPCIIFIDELDALGKTRGGGMPGGHDEREQTLNALLVEMDGFGSDQSVIVMAATNRPETLDPALLRPGRFDRHVVVDRPDIRGREKILKVHVKRIRMDESVDIGRIARLTPGFVGADLANLVNEAALLAARKGRRSVTMAEFEEGIERVIAGLEKQTRVLHEEEKLRVAYHECGHALVACSLPHTDPVHKISIIPRGMGALGYTMHRPDDERQLRTQSELISRICCLLGGNAAEKVVFDETSTGASNDFERATDIARRMVTEFGMSQKLGRIHYSQTRTSPFLGVAEASQFVHSEETMREIDLEVKRIMDECYETAIDILSRRRSLLEQMTRELMEIEVMDSDHLKRLLDEHHPGPQLVPGTYARPVTSPASVSTAAADESDQSHPDTAAGS